MGKKLVVPKLKKKRLAGSRAIYHPKSALLVKDYHCSASFFIAQY
jgi:hypothetical protein